VPSGGGTEPLYWHQPDLRRFGARVVARRDDGAGRWVALDRTAFYPTGGGQPHDTGWLGGWRVMEVLEGGSERGPVVWHRIERVDAAVAPAEEAGDEETGVDGPPSDLEVGREVVGVVDWDRRQALERGHTALHILCGVLCDRYDAAVTGGNIALGPGAADPAVFGGSSGEVIVAQARLDLALPAPPAGFAAEIEALANAEVDADRPVVVSFLPREVALADRSLVRTAEVRVPDDVDTVRVVEIVGLDRQADGGLHVASTHEVGRIRVRKVESKGRVNRRVRIEVVEPRGAGDGRVAG
jgi:misacylated tRNA(Ala) deacylase